MAKAVGILGGTFDPIHNGHLRSGLELLQQFNFEHIRLIPSARPPHRGQPQATPEQRVMMLHLAIKNSQQFVVDDRELKREGASYTMDTLRSLKQDMPDNPLYLIVGSDAFNQLSTWHQWQDLLGLCHIIVMERAGQPLLLSKEMTSWYHSHIASAQDKILLAGKIWPVSLTQLAISASAIRFDISSGRSPAFLTPAPVISFIEQLALYR
ncbi:MAG: nicotinate-nucleotide adenylyltransferase [Methylophagaceae bacterium]|jgi:nicotinate-nucleotide adenylyltransferase